MKHSMLLPVLAVSLLSLLAGCSDSKDVEEPAELVSLKSTLKVERLWSYGFSGDADQLRLGLRATVADGVTYAAGYGGEVVALSLDSGRKIWSVKTKLPLSAGPGVGGAGDQAIVVVGAIDGTVLALDAKTGAQRWRQQMSGELLTAPLVVDDVVIVRTVDGRVVALAASDAATRWSIEQPVPRLSLRGNAPPVLAGDSIIAAFDNGRVLAVELKTGDTQWDTVVGTPTGRSELERMVDIDAPVQVVGDDVFVVGFQSRVAMLARDSGQIWWARDFSSYRGLTIEGNSLYATNAEGVVVAMRRADGSVTWEQPAMRLRALTGPVLDGTSLIVGDYDGYVHWLSAVDGTLQARVGTDGERITNAPVVADGRVLVQTDGGKLIAFKATPKS